MAFVAVVGSASAIIALAYAGLIIYRLYFHPLAKFPGPKLAASSLWYEFYYDVVLRGQFMWRIQEMHGRYGPIVRINPDELHIDDPEYYDEIYGSTTKKRDKYDRWLALSPTPGASFTTVGHDLHRLRRGALNPFFSVKAVVELEPLVKAKVELLAKRLQNARDTGAVVRVDAAFMALTMDVICQYAFANDDNMLAKEDFDVAWKESQVGAFEGGALLRQFSSIGTIMNYLPDSMIKAMNPSMGLLLDWKNGVRKRVEPIFNRTESVSDLENASHRSIFHELRDSNLPPSEKTVDRLCDEGTILTGAGSETTAKVLTTAIFYMLNDTEVLKTLKNELLEGATEDNSWSKLAHLTYLSAVIAEALRLSHGVTVRLPRIATDEVLRYKSWDIPFKTPISSSAYFILMSPRIFPNPAEFRPERWIDATGKFDHAMEKKWLINFGRGSRSCVGMNLAYAEMYLTLATIVRRFDMELFETTVEDVTMVHDFFVAIPRLDSKGVRIKIV